jgi:hypothetical protein
MGVLTSSDVEVDWKAKEGKIDGIESKSSVVVLESSLLLVWEQWE